MLEYVEIMVVTYNVLVVRCFREDIMKKQLIEINGTKWYPISKILPAIVKQEMPKLYKKWIISTGK